MTDEEAQLLIDMLPLREMTLDDILHRSTQQYGRGATLYMLGKLVERGFVERSELSTGVMSYRRLMS